jgi:hypothetical protein
VTASPIGAHVGWVLDFRDGADDQARSIASLGSSSYDASFDASLPSGLEPGSYTFVVEGVSNDTYKDLYTCMKSGELVVRPHLFWRDTGGVTGFLVDLAGLSETIGGDTPPPDSQIATLRVTSLARRPGPRRYEVVIEAREWVYDRLLLRLAAEGKATDLLGAVATICDDRAIGVNAVPHGSLPEPQESDSTERDRTWERRQIALDRVRELGRAIEAASGRRGLGMFQIADRVLNFGPDRLQISDVYAELTDDTGLVEIRSRGMIAEDPYWVPAQDNDREPRRATYELVLRGRPDIKPGNFVEFRRPPEESDDAKTPNQFSLDLQDELTPGELVRLYVQSVTHSLSRDRPFVTVLRGMTTPAGETSPYPHAWFTWTSARTATPAHPAPRDATPEGAFVGELHATIDRAAGKRIDTAQVRGSNVVSGTKHPTQTEKLWRGLVADDGSRHAATALAFDAEHKSAFDDAPYVTPFAWGKFGLVLPRYPGMRVIVGHRNNENDDLLDLGATWTRGEAPASEAGDYWLSLPTQIPDDARAAVADGNKPADPTGNAANDLIDAKGARVIEVGKLTVRVGASLLKSGGTRPSAADDHVHIEHESGARITIDQDGNITIKAAGTLDFVAGGEITFDTPGNVTVKTDGFMDVKGRT